MSVDVDDLLVEQIAFEQQVGVGFGHRYGGLTGKELELAVFVSLQSSQENEEGLVFAAVGGKAQNESFDVARVEGGPHGELGDLAEALAFGIGNMRTEQRGDTRPVVFLEHDVCSHRTLPKDAR